MKKFILSSAFIILSAGLMAQKADSLKHPTTADSIFNSMNLDNKKQSVAIFESSRLILAQSTETIKKKNFNFMVIHRFGDFAGDAGGGKTFFGLDNVADVYIGGEYGLTNNLNIDLGRSSLPEEGGMVNLELKYALLHQMSDDSSPLAITLIGETGLMPYGEFSKFSDRMAYFAQAIFARKISRGLSLQIAPSYTRADLPDTMVPESEYGFFSLSATGRIKVTKLMGIILDYAHPFSSFRNHNAYSDPFGFGIQMVTGGHVFTVNITNSPASTEINYLSNTRSDYFRGNYRVGFTIARVFDFNHKEKYNSK